MSRKTAPGVLIGLAVAALTALLLWSTPLLAYAGLGGSRSIDLTLRQWGYEPGIITVQQGDRVTLHVHSMDVTHGFYLDAYGVQAVVNPDTPETVTFIADKPGRFTFRCNFTCGSFHPYMTGWLEVTPNRTARSGVALAFAAGAGFFGFVGWEALRK